MRPGSSVRRWVRRGAALACAALLATTAMTSTGHAAPVRFAIDIAPSRFQVAIPGQRIVVLVRIRSASDEAVTLRSRATDAWLDRDPVAVSPGQVVSVPVVPRAEGTVHARIVGTRRGLTVRRSIRIEVWEGTDGLRARATELRDRFVAWLAAERPELGIDATTTWHPTIYLRPRDAMRPTLAFQIDSVSDASAVPHEIDPPAEVMR